MTIVNLNKARKQRAREKSRKEADERSVRFGRTKAEKTRDKAEQDRANRHLDGAKRDP